MLLKINTSKKSDKIAYHKALVNTELLDYKLNTDSLVQRESCANMQARVIKLDFVMVRQVRHWLLILLNPASKQTAHRNSPTSNNIIHGLVHKKVWITNRQSKCNW